jgi:PPOX class probable F420-dependent enzyme
MSLKEYQPWLRPHIPDGNEMSERAVEQRMKLNDAARNLIGKGADATLVTINPDGSPQVSVVWVALRSTPDGDELVSAHLAEHKKVRNVRRDPRVAVTIVALDGESQGMRPYLSITGTAYITEGGAPELLTELNPILGDPNQKFPPDGAPGGYLTHIRIEKVGGIGPWS